MITLKLETHDLQRFETIIISLFMNTSTICNIMHGSHLSFTVHPYSYLSCKIDETRKHVNYMHIFGAFTTFFLLINSVFTRILEACEFLIPHQGASVSNKILSTGIALTTSRFSCVFSEHPLTPIYKSKFT